MGRPQLGCLLLAGCGRIAFDVAGDSRTDEPPGPMFESIDPRTLPPFQRGQLVPELSIPGVDDDDPCLARDQLEIFFDRGQDLYTSRRASILDPWPPATPIAELNTAASEEHPFVTADGARLYFTSGRGGDAQIYRATRADRDAPWQNLQLVVEWNSTEYEAMGGVSADERVAVFSSRRGGLATDDKFESNRPDASQAWSPPRALAELNTATFDRAAHLDDYGLVMYYERANTIVWSRRDDTSRPWEPATVVAELDLPNEVETDPWLSPDLRTIYFVSVNNGTKDIYVATR